MILNTAYLLRKYFLNVPLLIKKLIYNVTSALLSLNMLNNANIIIKNVVKILLN